MAVPVETFDVLVWRRDQDEGQQMIVPYYSYVYVCAARVRKRGARKVY